MYFVKTPKIAKYLYPKLIWEIPNKKNSIFLTFDDGPDEQGTIQILKILKEKSIKATFFCTGRRAEKHPTIIKQIVEDGHSIGNHTYRHLDGYTTKKDTYIKDVDKCFNYIKSNLFRPPYGKITKAQINTLRSQYIIILWTILPGDFDNKITKEKLLKRSIKNTKTGSIIVFHDNQESIEKLISVLPKYIDFCKSKGFVFEPISEELLIK